MHVCDPKHADSYLEYVSLGSQYALLYYNTLITKIGFADLFFAILQHTEEHLQSVLR